MSKKLILAAVMTVVSLIVPSSAKAGVLLTFDQTGGGSTATTDFLGFDWAPGNALADGGNQAVANFLAGGSGAATQFSLYYQARLSVLQFDSADTAPIAGREFTIVAGFREQVLAVNNVAGIVTATFGLVAAAPNFLEIYEGVANSNDLLGTGFNDGTRILAANIVGIDNSDFSANTNAPTDKLDKRSTDNYPGLRTIIGNGKTGLSGKVTSFNTGYFTGLSLLGLNVVFELNANFPTNLTVPFESVNPSSRFVKAGGGAAPVVDGAGSSTWSGANIPFTGTVIANSSIGLINGAFTGQGGGPDVQFQADASTTFDILTVPEPTSVAVWGIGAALALVVGRRRSTRKA